MRGKSLSVVIAASVLLAGAAAIGATVIERYNFKQEAAFAQCSASEVIDCGDGRSGQLTTDAFVDGFASRQKARQLPDESVNRAGLSIRIHNSCLGDGDEAFIAAFGGVEGGFSMQGNVQSARVRGTFPMETWEGQPFGTGSVDVTLDGVGEVQTDRFVFRFDFESDGGHVVVSTNNNTKSRPASASGTMTVNGQALSCTFIDAVLMDAHHGTHETIH